MNLKGKSLKKKKTHANVVMALRNGSIRLDDLYNENERANQKTIYKWFDIIFFSFVRLTQSGVNLTSEVKFFFLSNSVLVPLVNFIYVSFNDLYLGF